MSSVNDLALKGAGIPRDIVMDSLAVSYCLCNICRYYLNQRLVTVDGPWSLSLIKTSENCRQLLLMVS